MLAILNLSLSLYQSIFEMSEKVWSEKVNLYQRSRSGSFGVLLKSNRPRNVLLPSALSCARDSHTSGKGNFGKDHSGCLDNSSIDPRLFHDGMINYATPVQMGMFGSHFRLRKLTRSNFDILAFSAVHRVVISHTVQHRPWRYPSSARPPWP